MKSTCGRVDCDQGRLLKVLLDVEGSRALHVQIRMHAGGSVDGDVGCQLRVPSQAQLLSVQSPVPMPLSADILQICIRALFLIGPASCQQRGSLKAYISNRQPMLMQHPGQIEVHPLRTKTNAENTGRVRVEPAAPPILDLWFWLLALLANAISIRQPSSQCMVRASKPAVTQGSPSPVFADQQLCRSGLHDRLKKHLKQSST